MQEVLQQRLKHPHYVNEEEFLNYLQLICQDEYAKSLILAYYKAQKKLDRRHGKYLTAKAFLAPKVSDLEGDYISDQVKYLFEQDCEKTIGYAEFFRWQFVNLVDVISYEPTPIRGRMFNSAINIFTKTLTLAELEKNKGATPEEKEFLAWNDVLRVFHELNHLMTAQTYHDGKFECMIEGLLAKKKTACMFDVAIWKNKDGEMTKKTVDAFHEGIDFVNEVLTELYTAFFINDRTYDVQSIQNKRYTQSPLVQTCAMPNKRLKNWVLTSTYYEFGYIFYLICACKGLRYEKMFFGNPDKLPTTNALAEIKDFFKNTTLSPRVEKLINEKLASYLDIELSELEKSGQNYQKFLALFGIAEQEYDKGRDDEGFFEKTNNWTACYGEFPQLIEAMILDGICEKFKAQIETQIEVWQQSGGQKNVHKNLLRLAHRAEWVDDFVIKPNIKLGENDKGIRWAKFNLPNRKLVEMQPNVALETWVKCVDELLLICQKHDMSVISEHKFLSYEYQGFFNNLKTENLEKNNFIEK